MNIELTTKINGVVDNHTARILFPAVEPEVCANKGDIVEYARVQKVKKVGDGEDDYVVYEDVEEVSRCNRQAYISKDASDVGVLNILEKVRRSGDLTLLNQTHADIPEGIQDFTVAPESIADGLRALQKGSNSFDALKAIFGDKSFDELANMSPEDLRAAVAAYYQKIQPKKGEE